jgi:mannose-1-phosphate guanylyltransferase
MIHLVLLSGGSGTRLWPLSNNARSKQFLKVLRDADGNHVSMVQRVFGQISCVDANIDITIATTENQRYSIERQVEGDYSLVLEPERRDTAPAIMLACEHLGLKQGADEDDTVIVMPIDTYAEQGYYDCIPKIDKAVQLGVSDLTLLGVEPTYPSAKYGYIVPAANKNADVLKVTHFIEKPDEGVARELIDQGALWNCGVFAFRLGYLLNVTKQYLNKVTFQDYVDNYRKLPKNSFDYEVVERAQAISVVPYAGEWKDLGTWNTLTDEMAETVSGRAVVGDTCHNVHVINETELPMVVAGLKDAVVVATPDGILACSKAESIGIKPLVAQVAESHPMYEHCCWGEYRIINSSTYSDGRKSLLKELAIEAGKQLSYQKNQRCSEVWIVVSGEGEVVLDGAVRNVVPGDIVNVNCGCLYACRGITDIHIIDVQLGDVLSEEDTKRFSNFWNS